MHQRLLLASLFCLLSACGGDSHNDPVTPPAATSPAAPATTLSDATITEIDTLVQAQMSHEHITGLSLLVSMNGKPVLQKGYGVTNLVDKAPVTPATVFRLASVTKQFTATAILLLVQDGRIGLDDPMSKYLPTAPAAWDGITIRHLMQHTSGLPRDFSPELLEQIDPSNLPPLDTLVGIVGKMALDAKPGAAFSYSNMGYHLLGFVIEKASGKHYAQFLQERVFGPLGMSSADVIRTGRPPASMASGYMWNGSTHVPASAITLTPGLVEAEGGLQMNAVDLAKWDTALLGETILNKTSQAQLWAPARLNDGSTVQYGLGWELASINNLPFTRHSGSIDGFASQIDRHTGQGLSVIVLDNAEHSSVGALATRIGSIIDPRLEWVIAATDPQPAGTALLRTLLDETMRGVLAVDQRFTPQARAAMTPELVAAYQGYFGKWAPIERFGYIDQVTIGGQQVARYLVRSRFEHAVFGIRLDADGKLAYLTVLSD